MTNLRHTQQPTTAYQPDRQIPAVRYTPWFDADAELAARQTLREIADTNDHVEHLCALVADMCRRTNNSADTAEIIQDAIRCAHGDLPPPTVQHYVAKARAYWRHALALASDPLAPADDDPAAEARASAIHCLAMARVIRSDDGMPTRTLH